MKRRSAMKKLLIGGLSLLLLTACSPKSTAKYTDLSANEQYKVAMETFKKVSSYTASVNVDMIMRYDGEEMSIPTVMDIKANNAQDINAMEMEIHQTIEGMDQTMYLKDGYIYISLMGQNMKMAVDNEQIEELTKNAQVQEYDENMMNNLSSEVKDDLVYINFEMNDAYLNDLLAQFMSVDELAEDVTVTIHSSKGTLITDINGNIVQNIMDIDMETTTDGMTIGLVMKTDMTYSDLNKTTISFPEDLDSYVLTEE